MQVTIKFNSHTSKGESCGEIEIRDNDNVFQEQKSFTQKLGRRSVWVLDAGRKPVKKIIKLL